jgi:hypothetical protein
MTTAACRHPFPGRTTPKLSRLDVPSAAPALVRFQRSSKNLIDPKQTARDGCTTCKVESFPTDRFISDQPSLVSPVSSARTRVADLAIYLSPRLSDRFLSPENCSRADQAPSIVIFAMRAPWFLWMNVRWWIFLDAACGHLAQSGTRP